MVFKDATCCLIYLLVKTIPVPVQQRIWKCKCNLEKPGTSEVFYLDDMTCSVFWNIYQHFYLTCKLKTKTNQKKKKNEMRKMTSIQKQQACYYTTAQRITTNKTFGWIHCWWCSWILVDCYNNNKSFPSISSALLTVSVSPLRRRTKKCGFPLVTLLTWLLRTTNNFCLLFFFKHKVVFVYLSILL